MANSRDLANFGDTINGVSNVNIDNGTLFVDAINNYIGINTTTPAAILQVAGALRVGANSTSSTASTGAIYNDGSNGISIEAFVGNNVASKKDIYLAAYGGKVGIGTTSPSGALDVASRGITRGSMPVGSIIQYARGTNSSAIALTNVTNGTEYDPSLSVSITPSASSSRILIFVNMQVWMQSGSGTWYGHPRIYRGGTQIYDAGGAAVVFGASTVEAGGLWSTTHVDAPNTTSSTTYSVKWVHDGQGTMNNLVFHRGNSPAAITVMEIAQ